MEGDGEGRAVLPSSCSCHGERRAGSRLLVELLPEVPEGLRVEAPSPNCPSCGGCALVASGLTLEQGGDP